MMFVTPQIGRLLKLLIFVVLSSDERRGKHCHVASDVYLANATVAAKKR